MISPDLAYQLRDYFPEGAPWSDIEVTQQTLRGLALFGPASLAARAVGAVTLPGAAANLQTVGLTIGRHIYLDPSFGQLDTAAGQALLAHEVVHVNQGERDRNFGDLYEKASYGVDPNTPWKNPYEAPAYARECEVYWGQIAKGWPPGSWKPMGVQLGLCAGT